MTEGFQDLTGSTFERADLQGSRFDTVLLNGSRIDNSDLHRVTMRGVEISDTTISGEIKNLVINGVDVAPLVEAELDRRHPDRPKFRPVTADGFREAWDVNERLWNATVEPGAPAASRTSCTSRSTGSGRSSRPCATWRSPASRGSGGASSATRARGTRCRCRGTR